MATGQNAKRSDANMAPDTYTFATSWTGNACYLTFPAQVEHRPTKKTPEDWLDGELKGVMVTL